MVIPSTFEEWYSCITQQCRISLTKEFASDRLAVYQQANHAETIQFVHLYGQQHLSNIIRWLQRVVAGG